MSEVVPPQIDLQQLFAIPLGGAATRLGLDAVGEETQRFPRGLDVRLNRAGLRSEDLRLRTQGRAPFEDRRQSAVRVERNAPVLLVFRGRTGNADLARVPVDAFVLDQQHLAASAAELERANDSIVEQRANELVFGGVHPRQRRVEQLFLFAAGEPAIA